MALKTCPDCKREISDQAPICPGCGRPNTVSPPPQIVAQPVPRAKKAPSKAVTWGSLAVLLILAVIIRSGGSDRSSTSTPKSIDLNARVRFSGTKFVITNNDTFRWSACEFYLNSKMFSLGFSYRAGMLEPNATYSVGALQFTDNDGKRFNPFEYKPTSLFISCDTPTGRGSHYGEFR